MAMLDALNPGFKAIHYDPADGPTECVTLLAQHFVSTLWETLANMPTYGEWLLAVDETDAYAYHHDVLQVLQSRAPGRWSLKSPHHGLAVRELRAQYPDRARRGDAPRPGRPSSRRCAASSSRCRARSATPTTPQYIAAHWPEVAEVIVTRIAEYRDAHGDDGFLDVQYPDLMADPIGVVRAIYEWEGTEYTPVAEAAMRAYMADNQQGKFGRHAYSLEPFGLDAGELTERFAPYVERFGVRPEAVAGSLPRHVGELGEVVEEREAGHAGGPVSVLGHDHFRRAALIRLRVVDLVAVQEDHDVRVLLERSATHGGRRASGACPARYSSWRLSCESATTGHSSSRARIFKPAGDLRDLDLAVLGCASTCSASSAGGSRRR